MSLTIYSKISCSFWYFFQVFLRDSGDQPDPHGLQPAEGSQPALTCLQRGRGRPTRPHLPQVLQVRSRFHRSVPDFTGPFQVSQVRSRFHRSVPGFTGPFQVSQGHSWALPSLGGWSFHKGGGTSWTKYL
jgi:hypothetical protein